MVPTLDRAATELGGEGLPLLGGPTLFGLRGELGAPDVGGVAKVPRVEMVGEKGGSGFWY